MEGLKAIAFLGYTCRLVEAKVSVAKSGTLYVHVVLPQPERHPDNMPKIWDCTSHSETVGNYIDCEVFNKHGHN